jgi:acetyltransferase-like isoleucine patch superfamily enzyme
VSDLRPSGRAPGLLIAPGSEVHESAVLGANVVIHAQVQVGAGCVVQDGAVLGKRPVLAAGSATRDAEDPVTLILESGAQVGCYAVIAQGARIGSGAVVGDHAFLRDRVVVGHGSVVGHGTSVGLGVAIGRHVRIQSGCRLAIGSIVEDDVFCGPNLATTDDATMGDASAGALVGALLRRGCRVGASVTVLPGVEVGAGAMVGAASVVTRDVAPRTLVMGAPARLVRRLDEG